MFLNQDVVLDMSPVSNVQILTVDNDRDTGALYTALLKDSTVSVVATESIKSALDLLNQFTPNVLVCEARFLGESVYPLIRKVRSIAQTTHRVIPIFVTSTFSATNLTKHLTVKVEAYQIKPIDSDRFVDEVGNLLLLSKITQPLTIHDWLVTLDIGEISCCCEGVG